ncbi:MAG: hypothetical protein ACK5LK_04120 [Chthoniobacterales bacterium]
MKRIAFTAHKQAELIDTPDFDKPVGEDSLRGKTLCSLVSSGTELNFGYLSESDFPKWTG